MNQRGRKFTIPERQAEVPPVFLQARTAAAFPPRHGAL